MGIIIKWIAHSMEVLFAKKEIGVF